MALDREQLEEIKAYMDAKADGWKLQAGEAARSAARDEVLAADARIARRNTVFGAGLGVVLLSALGFSYQSVSSSIDSSANSAELKAVDAAKAAAEEILTKDQRVIDQQNKFIEGIVQAQTATRVALRDAEKALEDSETALGSANDGLAGVNETKDGLDAQIAILATEIQDLGNLRDLLREESELLKATLQEAKEARSALVIKSEQVDRAVSLSNRLIGEKGQIDDIVLAALGDEEIRREIVNAAAFPSGAIVPFSETRELVPICPEGWTYFADARDRFLMGASEFVPEGQAGGEATVTLTVDQMPRHKHEVLWRDQHTISLNNARGSLPTDNQYRLEWRGGAGLAGDNMSATWAGGSEPHNNIPPYIAVHFCKKK